MKRFIAILLAMVMVFGLGTMAMAAAPNEKVQINNMMVDASMVEAKTEEAVAVQAQPESVSVQTDLVPNEYFPPLQHIEIPGYEENISFALQNTTVLYTLDLPVGTTIDDVNSRGVLFTFGGTSASSQVTGNITVTYNEQEYSAAKGGSVNVPMSLIMDDYVVFNISWNVTIDGTTTTRTRQCGLQVRANIDTTEVSVSSIQVVGEDKSVTPTSDAVGGVTRYSCNIGLEKVTTLTGLTVDVTLGSSNANATLGGVSGTKTGNKVTFTNVDLTSSKELVVTNTTYTRTYQVSAYLKNSKVTVYFAIRTYLAKEWTNASTTYYDYAANNFGSGADLSATEKAEIRKAYTGIAKWNVTNAPESIDETTGRPIFSQGSYVAIEMDADKTVMDVLTTFIDSHTELSQTGAGSNYVSEIAYNGNALGEFTCGQGSGWMYTARNSRTDVTTALPNAGAATWAISNGMYIDWYYTAAYGMDFGYSMFDM